MINQAEKQELIIDIMAEEIQSLREAVVRQRNSISELYARTKELHSENEVLRKKAKPRGPDRPKGSKTKAKAGLKMVLKGGVRK